MSRFNVAGGAGAIGVISQNAFAEFCVGLRSAKLTHQQLHLFAVPALLKNLKQMKSG